MIVAIGDQVQPDNYNAVLGVDAGPLCCLPARLGEPVATGEYLLDPLDYQHPIVQPFRNHERAGLLTTPIWKYVRLQPAASADVQPVMAFQNGDPAMLEGVIGQGHVISVAPRTRRAYRSIDRPHPPRRGRRWRHGLVFLL